MTYTQLSSEGVGYPGLPSLNGKNGYSNGDMVSRPELEVFGLAMLGGGNVFGAAHPYGNIMPRYPDLYRALTRYV